VFLRLSKPLNVTVAPVVWATVRGLLCSVGIYLPPPYSVFLLYRNSRAIVWSVSVCPASVALSILLELFFILTKFLAFPPVGNAMFWVGLKSGLLSGITSMANSVHVDVNVMLVALIFRDTYSSLYFPV